MDPYIEAEEEADRRNASALTGWLDAIQKEPDTVRPQYRDQYSQLVDLITRYAATNNLREVSHFLSYRLSCLRGSHPYSGEIFCIKRLMSSLPYAFTWVDIMDERGK